MKVAVIQSNYIPWKGYFDIINSADLFIFYDDVKYTQRDWRNRNLIKTPNGSNWLTIPCGNQHNKLICEVQLKNKYWQNKHWRSIEINYSKAKYFHQYKSLFKYIYLGKVWVNLSEFNQYFIKLISKEILKIQTKFEDSRIYNLTQNKEFRLLELLKKCKATEYLSGPKAKSYLEEELLQKNGIKITWMNYDNYPEYDQLYPPFEHKVSIIDLIFNEGPNAKNFMNSFS